MHAKKTNQKDRELDRPFRHTVKNRTPKNDYEALVNTFALVMTAADGTQRRMALDLANDFAEGLDRAQAHQAWRDAMPIAREFMVQKRCDYCPSPSRSDQPLGRAPMNVVVTDAR